MTVYRPPGLDKNVPIVDPATGRITPYLQRFWQNLAFTAADGANQASGSQTDITALQNQVTSLTATVATKVAKSTFAGYTIPTGTQDRTGYTVYASPTISNPPTQAQVQAISDAVQVLSQHVAALIKDLKT